MHRFAFLAVAAAGCHFTDGLRPVSDGQPADVAIDSEVVIDAAPLPRDCEDAFDMGVTTDGIVKIDPDGAGGNDAFDAYCDMTTAGGGWTLVWVYGFRNFGMFTDGTNAVDPRPSWPWPLVGAMTPVSTTIPTSPTTPGALDFARWPTIGDKLLVESNTNHWVTCTPNGGSLVAKTPGPMTCSLVFVQTGAACNNKVPAYFNLGNGGPGLFLSSNLNSTFYFWDGRSDAYWPAHDPCGGNQPRQLSVANPYGAIFLKR